MLRILMAFCLGTAVCSAVDPPTAPPATPPAGCAGSSTLGTFQLSVRPFSQGAPLPLKSVAAVPAGSRLVWNPLHLRLPPSNSAEVTAVLVPTGEGPLITLEPRKASARTEWQLLERPLVIALVYGPQGLSEGKLQSLVTRNQDLLRQLADYAEQSSEVESLVQELADAEQSRAGADSALKGVSAQYGVSAQKLSTTPSDQQAALLLKALIPASNSYDPLANQSVQVAQSGGLAASVAGLFFGNPVGLAAGGAALFQNLKTVLFPNTEFRSAFAQTAEKGGLALCTKNQTAKSKTRTAYLWAYRVPQWKTPSVTLSGSPNVPVGAKSTVPVKYSIGVTAKELALARDWHLTASAGGAAIPVDVHPNGASGLELDLTQTKLPAGDYQLGATWDWTAMPVAGTVHLRPFADLSHAAIAPASRDKLVEGGGAVAVELTGVDFEFLESAVIESASAGKKPAEAPFTLPLGKRAGPQNSVTVTIDTATPGQYQLALTQTDGVAHKIPLSVLPPNPKISNLPLHLNVGEKVEAIRLTGGGVDRIDGVESDAGEIAGTAGADGWSGEIHLKSGLKKGQSFALQLKVKGLDAPVTLAHAIEMVGARPEIRAVQRSLSGALGIEIAADELPAGTPAGLVLTVDHLRDAVRPRVELRCEGGELREALTLSPGTPVNGASLTSAGPGALYLSVDPGTIGYAGCLMTATVAEDPEGRSDPFVLGRVVRLPRLDRFTLTSEKAGDAAFVGAVEGSDLDVIEKVGWDGQNGIRVEAIPTPLPGAQVKQTLRLVLPWPAPAPHAPLYVWLRGESQGRKTAVAY